MAKKLFNVEKGSQRLFGFFILLLALSLVLTSLGRSDLLFLISGATSTLLGLFLYIEGGVREWLKRKGYKTLDGGDLLVISSFVFGTFLLMNALIIFFGDGASGKFFDFIRGSGVVGGIIAGILGLLFLFIKRPSSS